MLTLPFTVLLLIGYQAFVYVPYTSAEAQVVASQTAAHQRPSYPYVPFLCYCKRNSAGAVLTKSSTRSCALLGSCATFSHLITDYGKHI